MSVQSGETMTKNGTKKMPTSEYEADNVYDECEVHENCTVEIWRNSKTGKISIGWYENKDERKND